VAPTAEAAELASRSVKELGEEQHVVIGAPLGNGGAVGVTREGNLIVRDGDSSKMYSLYAQGPIDPAAVRFADLDGDGRTDVAVSATELSLSSGEVDQIGELAAWHARTADEAVARALALPRDPVTPAEACAVLGKIQGAADLKAVSAPGAELVSFEEPDRPSWNAQPVTKDAWKELQQDIGSDCLTETSCDATRPGCTVRWEPPGVDFFLFTRGPSGKLLLVRGALYRGT
jgi:hypothetical protein